MTTDEQGSGGVTLVERATKNNARHPVLMGICWAICTALAILPVAAVELALHPPSYGTFISALTLSVALGCLPFGTIAIILGIFFLLHPRFQFTKSGEEPDATTRARFRAEARGIMPWCFPCCLILLYGVVSFVEFELGQIAAAMTRGDGGCRSRVAHLSSCFRDVDVFDSSILPGIVADDASLNGFKAAAIPSRFRIQSHCIACRLCFHEYATASISSPSTGPCD